MEVWGVSAYPKARPNKEEYLDVLNLLEGHIVSLSEPSENEDKAEKRLNKRMRGGMILFGLAVVILIASAFSSLYAFALQIAYAVVLISATVVSALAITRSMAERSETWRALKRPRQAMIANLKIRHDDEEKLISQLMSYQSTTLEFTRARLAERMEIQKERGEAIFGGISKIGLFPSVLAAIVGAVSAVKGAQSWVIIASAAATGLLILNQDVASEMHLAVVDTKVMIGLLDRAIRVQAGADPLAEPAQHPVPPA